MSLRAIGVLLIGVFATLRISIPTMFEVARKTYRRDVGDQRLKWWSSKLLEHVKLSSQVVNKDRFEFKPGVPYIIMCNHSSLYDIPLTFVSLEGSIRMLAKKELFKVPIWGKAMEAGEFISIDRHNRQQAFQDLDRAREKMESGIILWIAPEGTRSKTGELQPFKKGGFRLAMQTGATIIPVGIRGAQDVLSKGTWNINMGQHAEVHIGKPIDSQQYGKREYPKLMEDVEAQILQLADVPKMVTESS